MTDLDRFWHDPEPEPEPRPPLVIPFTGIVIAALGIFAAAHH